MLNHMATAHFNAFGYVVLRGLLNNTECGQLRSETEFALENAYGNGYGASDIDVCRRPAFDLPVMSEDTPLSASLVVDDQRLWQASHYLLGAPTIPTNAEAICFLANSRWHADLGPEVAGVKFMAYLDPCSAEEGQLHVCPGSHLPGTRAAFWEYIRQDPRRQGYLEDPDEWPVPGVGIEIEPGDVIAFHVNLLHSSVGGERRLAWAVYYFPDPVLGGDEQWEFTRDAILHIGDYGDRDFDHDKWPVWRHWASSPNPSDARVAAINRLRRIGVIDTEGAGMGKPRWQPRLRNPGAVWSCGAPPRRRKP
jgi:hypothetical protein